MRITFPYLVAAVAVVLILGVGYFAEHRNASESTPKPVATEQQQTEKTTPAEPASPPVEQPETAAEPAAPAATAETNKTAPTPNLVPAPKDLANSDSAVLKVLKELSPTLTKWFIPDQQIRKWVLTVDLLADGKLPKRYRPLNYPMKQFAVEKHGDTLVAADDNYARLTPLLKAVTSIDPRRLAQYYRAWKPLLEKAYREQGKPGTFEERLLMALSQIMAVDPLREKAALVQPGVFYLYRDKKLEAASDIDKLGWRMGEKNLTMLQTFARNLRDQINPM